MKTTIYFYIGIVIVGIVSAVSIFSSMPADTWKDHRTESAGVASPDEIDEKMDCLSKGGTWDYASCKFEPESDDFTAIEEQLSCVDCFEENKELVEAFKEKYSEFGIIEYNDSNGIPYKYSAKTSNRDVELILGLDRNVLRSFEKDTDDSICTIINPFPRDVFDYCPPKW